MASNWLPLPVYAADHAVDVLRNELTALRRAIPEIEQEVERAEKKLGDYKAHKVDTLAAIARTIEAIEVLGGSVVEYSDFDAANAA